MKRSELLTLDDALEVLKAVRGHTSVRARRLERVGPGSHRTERKEKGKSEEEDIEKARTKGAKDIKKRKKRDGGVEKFYGGVGIRFKKQPTVEKFRGGVGIRFD